MGKFKFNDMYGSGARVLGIKNKKRGPDIYEKIGSRLGFSTKAEKKAERKEAAAEERKKRNQVKGLTDKSIFSTSPGETTARYKLKKALERGDKDLEHTLKYDPNPTYQKYYAKIAKHSPKVARHLAANPYLSHDNQLKVASGGPEAKKAMLRRPDCSRAVVEECLNAKGKGKTKAEKKAYKAAYISALKHKNCPPGDLKIFKIGPFTFPRDPEVRRAILANKNTTAASLANARLDHYEDALLVAKHANTDQATLNAIMTKWKDNPEIVEALLKRKDKPEDFAAIASRSRNPEITKLGARYADKELQKVLKTKRHDEVRLGLAQNKDISDDAQKRLIKHADVKTKVVLARNPGLLPDNQKALLAEKDADINLGLAQNGKLDAEVECELVASGDPEVKKALDAQKPMFSFGLSFTGGRCSRCGRPISGKHGNLGDKCRRKD